MFKLQGTYFLPYDFSVSANFVAQTGKPIARMIPVDGMNQGAFSVMAEPRGANYRLDPMYAFDLRLEKRIRLGSRIGVHLSADVFNLFNAHTMTQTVIVGTSESFMKPDAIAAPRRVQTLPAVILLRTAGPSGSFAQNDSERVIACRFPERPKEAESFGASGLRFERADLLGREITDGRADEDVRSPVLVLMNPG